MSQTNPPPVQLRIGNEDLATGSGGVYKHLHPVTQQVQAQRQADTEAAERLASAALGQYIAPTRAAPARTPHR